jgi:hypothetical protein
MGVVANLVVRVSASIKDFERDMAGLNGSMLRVGSKMQSIGASMTAGVTLPIAALGAAAVRSGLEFEGAMNKIDGVLQPTARQMESLRQKAIEMGAATVFSATDSATAMLELGKAGFTTEEALTGVSDVLQLAAASGLSMGEAAELSARTLSAFGVRSSRPGPRQ